MSNPTFHGYAYTDGDIALILQGCRQEILTIATNRPNTIESGHIYVSRTSDIKRWADGLKWTCTRRNGDITVYKQLDPTSNTEVTLIRTIRNVVFDRCRYRFWSYYSDDEVKLLRTLLSPSQHDGLKNLVPDDDLLDFLQVYPGVCVEAD